MGSKVYHIYYYLLCSLREVNKHNRLTKIISLVEKTLKWPLLSGSPLSRWVSGRVVVLGDAAHAMLPYMSQGMFIYNNIYILHSRKYTKTR